MIPYVDDQPRPRAIHLFAGAGGGLLGGLLLGWRTVCAVEVDRFCRDVLTARQNDGTLEEFPIWDDVRTFDGRPWAGCCDVLCGGFPCFVAGTLVLTDSGYKPIESIVPGDTVLTHTGRWRHVTAVMCKAGARVGTVSGFGILPTTCTPNHRYYTTGDSAGEYRWTEARNLRRRADCTTVTLPAEEPDPHTEAWWYLCGRYLADGWRVDRKGRKYGRTVICCRPEKRERLEQAIRDAGYQFTAAEERTCVKLHITKGDLYRDLAPFGRGAGGKVIPRQALCLSRSKATALLQGYLDGDGSWTAAGHRRVQSVSPALILGMQLVSIRAGWSCPAVYRSVVNSTCVIEGRVCHQRDNYILQWGNSANRARWRMDGDTVVRWCYGYEDRGERTTVYNLSVEGDESYVANGAAVHNCQNVSPLGDHTGIRGSKSCLWCEFARIAGEVRPRWVFVENSSDLIKLGLDVVLQDFDALGYDAEWECLSAAELGAPHIRDRIWVLAKARGPVVRGDTRKDEGAGETSGGGGGCAPAPETVRVLADPDAQRREEHRNPLPAVQAVHTTELPRPDNGGRVVQLSWWAREPGVCRVADGVANGVDRLGALGNGQVPYVAARAFADLYARFAGEDYRAGSGVKP